MSKAYHKLLIIKKLSLGSKLGKVENLDLKKKCLKFSSLQLTANYLQTYLGSPLKP